MQWDNLDTPVTIDDNLAFGQILIMFIVDSILYTLVMWYVEAVFPGDYGIPQTPYFFLLVSCKYISVTAATRTHRIPGECELGMRVGREDIGHFPLIYNYHWELSSPTSLIFGHTNNAINNRDS